MNEVTQQLAETLYWMIEDMNYRREQTGLEETPRSPEMQLAIELRDDLLAGRIECRRVS